MLACNSNRFAAATSNAYNNPMSTAQEIEEVIRSLSPSEREKLRQHIPRIFPEFAGDAEWERILRDDRRRPALTELLNRYEADLSGDPEKLPKIAENDFESPA
jgi:hypothetical protein